MLKLIRNCRRMTVQLSDFKTTQSTINGPVISNHLRHPSLIQHRTCSTNIKDDDGGELDIEALTNGDEELKHKLKVLMLEAEVMRQDGRNVPSNEYMKQKHWEELLNLQSRSARRKYLDFVFKNEKKRENLVFKKEKKKQERELNDYEPNIHGALRYDLGHNNILLRVFDSTINQLYNNKLVQAMQFGQKIVVDCGYHSNMTSRENVNCAKQIMYVFSENRTHDDPYDIHYCNMDISSSLGKALHRNIPTMYDDWFPFNYHEESYLDLYPKDKIVYLTPHCREELTEYDHDAIYIIGGIVDKVNNEPLSLAKAKKEGLKMAKLPLDRYLQWGPGSGKSLTLNQMINVLLDVKKTGDWEYALRHVPRRKLHDFYASDDNIANKQPLRFDKNRSQFVKKYKKEQSSKERMVRLKSIMYD